MLNPAIWHSYRIQLVIFSCLNKSRAYILLLLFYAYIHWISQITHITSFEQWIFQLTLICEMYHSLVLHLYCRKIAFRSMNPWWMHNGVPIFVFQACNKHLNMERNNVLLRQIGRVMRMCSTVYRSLYMVPASSRRLAPWLMISIVYKRILMSDSISMSFTVIFIQFISVTCEVKMVLKLGMKCATFMLCLLEMSI